MALNQNINSSQLKSFQINGLFGLKDVKIPFDKEAVILIAENGSGKTTILNALYYSISCKFRKLSNIDFESVVLEFVSGVTVEIKKIDIVPFYEGDALEIFSSMLRRVMPRSEIDRLVRDIRRGMPPSSIRRRIFDFQERSSISLPSNFLDELIEDVYTRYQKSDDNDRKERTAKIKKTIQENLNESILYFPTYRRIEEDFKNLGYENGENFSLGDDQGKLIQFGMNDVIAKFNEIKEAIRSSALELFSKVTGEMLSQFVDGVEITQDMRNSIQPETLNIVLARVGEKNISSSYREKIEQLVSSGEINSSQYEQLVYFLSKLVVLYEQQKEKDDSIKRFAEICNEYLNKKSIVYDEASVDISIIQTRNNKPIELRSLSSGEKQIISLFSKIYLELSDDFILLFDEPELSLSIEWQKLLLPHILESGKCKLLLAATHSPFIFENELDENADDLELYVKEK
jgi:predicted ATPase